jgi:hypothetical protein
LGCAASPNRASDSVAMNSKDAATRLSRMYLGGWTLTPFPALTD